MVKHPKISIVTISFNAQKTIEQTIRSVLLQEYNNIEYIVIDGASTDGTVDVIKKYSKKIAYWISEKDSGIYYAMNKGIEVASGDFLIFMNAGDCLYTSHIIKDIVSEMVNVDNWDIIYYGDCIHKLKYKKRYVSPCRIDFIKRSMPFSHQSTFVPLRLAKKMPFDTHYKLAADYDFFLKQYLKNTKYVYINKPISIIDLSEGATICNFKGSQREAYQIRVCCGSNRLQSWIVYQKCLIRFYISGIVKKILRYN